MSRSVPEPLRSHRIRNGDYRDEESRTSPTPIISGHYWRNEPDRTFGRNRTDDLPLRRRARYPLRYEGMVPGEGLEPPVPKRRLYRALSSQLLNPG